MYYLFIYWATIYFYFQYFQKNIYILYTYPLYTCDQKSSIISKKRFLIKKRYVLNISYTKVPYPTSLLFLKKLTKQNNCPIKIFPASRRHFFWRLLLITLFVERYFITFKRRWMDVRLTLKKRCVFQWNPCISQDVVSTSIQIALNGRQIDVEKTLWISSLPQDVFHVDSTLFNDMDVRLTLNQRCGYRIMSDTRHCLGVERKLDFGHFNQVKLKNMVEWKSITKVNISNALKKILKTKTKDEVVSGKIFETIWVIISRSLMFAVHNLLMYTWKRSTFFSSRNSAPQIFIYFSR